MAAIEKAINDFFNSGSLKAAAYRANAIFGFSSKVRRSYVKYHLINTELYIVIFSGVVCSCLCLLDVNGFFAGYMTIF